MAKEINVRELVLESLTEIDRGERSASQSMEETLRQYQYLSKQERSFYTRLCQGTIEYRLQLDYLIDQVSNTPVKRCKPYIRNILRMSLYQIRFMDGVPEAAVCNEAVKLAEKKGFRSLKGFVNGVLRNLIRQQDTLTLPDRETDMSLYLSIVYSMPEWLVQELIEWYGSELTEGMLEAFLQDSPLTVRINQLRTSKEEVIKLLESEEIQVEEGYYAENALRLSGINYVNRIKPFRQGLITIQDESSILQGYLIYLFPGAQVLDLCAAPGGKTLHAAERLLVVENQSQKQGEDIQPGRVISRDISDHKLIRIQENAERMGYSNVQIEKWDARQPEEKLFQAMDLVIADLPCSGLGVIGRKPDIKYRLTKEQFEELVELQREILKTAGQYVKPGGRLIYSTCTINPKENQEQVAWIQEHLPLESVPLQAELPETLVSQLAGQPGTDLEEGYCTLIPGKQHCDGFFMAVFQRKVE